MLKEKILRLPPAFALAFMVVASGVSSQVLAETTLTHVEWILDEKENDGIGDTEVVKDEEGNFYFVFYDVEGKYTGIMKLDGDPQPDGSPSGLFDAKAAIEKLSQNGGAEIVKENNFLETTLGQTLIKHSDTGSIIPFHNPVPIDSSVNPGTGASNPVSNPVSNGLSEDSFGDKTFEQEKNQSSLGGGWYDPMGGSMIEQMIKAGKKNKGKDNKGSGDAGSDAHDPGYIFSADPALVNPVPINLPVAKPEKKKVQTTPAPALVKKSKKRLRNVVSRKKRIRTTSKFYPTIPNLPRAAITTNIQIMQGMGGGRRKLR